MSPSLSSRLRHLLKSPFNRTSPSKVAPLPLASTQDIFGQNSSEEERAEARKREKEEKRKLREAEAARIKEEEERAAELAGMYQNRLEEKILGTTLEEDIARWEDAVRLFRTMTRLGDDTAGLVDATLYGEHFHSYFEVQEEVRRRALERERFRYRVFDEDGHCLKKETTK